jgi:hypothetical protein
MKAQARGYQRNMKYIITGLLLLLMSAVGLCVTRWQSIKVFTQ